MTTLLLDANDITQCISGLNYEAALAFLSSGAINSFQKSKRYYTTPDGLAKFVARNPQLVLTEHGKSLISAEIGGTING